MFMTGVLCTVCGAQVYFQSVVIVEVQILVKANFHFSFAPSVMK